MIENSLISLLLLLSAGLLLVACGACCLLLYKQKQRIILQSEQLLTLQNLMLDLDSGNKEYTKILTDGILSGINSSNSGLMQSHHNSLESIRNALEQLRTANAMEMENIRKSISHNLESIRNDNSAKLESIRHTVSEKLESTLEQRLGSSFKIVSERLEQVYRSIGEVQNLASGVGDLKKVLSNIKTRGIWGEVQIEAILEQILTPAQYEKNVQVNKKKNTRVEYAIKLPAKEDSEKVVYIPIDSKFPLEDYQRLVAAQELGDINEIKLHSDNLIKALKTQAKLISDKYIDPPYTTDFAILFLPLEALYAESLRTPGIIEMLQRDYRIIVTSPTTFSAILNSLQMGFKTLAIEKHSSEVWKLLSKVKVEFTKFVDILGKTKLKLDQASKIIGDAESKSRNIQSKLNRVDGYELEASDIANDPTQLFLSDSTASNDD